MNFRSSPCFIRTNLRRPQSGTTMMMKTMTTTMKTMMNKGRFLPGQDKRYHDGQRNGREIPMPEIGSAVFECESVEEAREKAAELWGIKADDIEARIISEEKTLWYPWLHIQSRGKTVCPVTFIKSCHFVNEILRRWILTSSPS